MLQGGIRATKGGVMPAPRRPFNHEPPLSIPTRLAPPTPRCAPGSSARNGAAGQRDVQAEPDDLDDGGDPRHAAGCAVEGVVSMDKWLLVLAAEIALAAIIIANLPALLRLH